MLSISELRPIPGQQHWETIVLFRTDSQGILGLLALRENNVLFMISLKNWTTPSTLPDRAAAGFLLLYICLKIFQGYNNAITKEWCFLAQALLIYDTVSFFSQE